MSVMVDRIEASLDRLIPEGSSRDMTPRQYTLLTIAVTWRECFESYGESHGATLGCLLDLVREAWGPGAVTQVTRYGEFAAALVLLRESCEIAHQTGNETTPVAEALVSCLEAAP